MFKRIELVSEDVKSVTNAQKAQILMNALPYIKKYSGKIVVVKYGGNAMINEDLKKSVMGDIVLLNLIGVKVVLVHGGGPRPFPARRRRVPGATSRWRTAIILHCSVKYGSARATTCSESGRPLQV